MDQMTHYEKLTALHKLILIVLEWTNQTKRKFPAKSGGARAIFNKLLWGRFWLELVFYNYYPEITNYLFYIYNCKHLNYAKYASNNSPVLQATTS